MPRVPRPWEQLLNDLKPERLAAVFFHASSLTNQGKYLHWNKLIRYPLPEGLESHEEWWIGLKLSRSSLFKEIPLLDKTGKPFKYLVTDPIPEQLHKIDRGAGGQIGVPELVINPETRNQYYLSSLVEEAITSSQLEGATTTREVAKEMIQAARPPRDHSERMIFNNYRTMQQIGSLKNQPLTPELIFHLHRLVTDQTLSDPMAAGRYRRSEENIIVGDTNNRIFHVPPPASELESRMAALCDFANGITPDFFLHPVLRAIILHFWLGYDHPFVDGNGRTARALFYWSMLHYGFWLCEYISISRILLQAPSKYGMAFLYTETDDNDLTYFLLHQIDVIRRAVDDLHSFIHSKTLQLQAAEQELRGLVLFNPRQRGLLSHAMRHPHFQYTVEGHRRSHNVVYETARADLMDLKAKGLLDARKIGRTWNFSPVPDIANRLANPGS